MEKYMLPCLTKKYLGFECMGCGLQRSLVALLQGHFSEAFTLYPAIFPLALLGFMVTLNFMFTIKFATKIISFLAILSVSTIIVSYILKLTS
ncbi:MULTISPECIES: DUF2752 domain-containing protein [Leeuwenhoekiella]|jgi:hypothetical protein|uniref:DUF2752 domain-containing protein n=2 Tax=Flavobacteriaceae TaxID=49546 RepID=A3XNI3_LEEBM|nr:MULTISPECIES: DUF2752 domain-containing protein [Leeuwenhoekiella]EAQ48891.1 hypothetical protein MED217_10092 [Leeuwenhoekiella blandensis MED217]MAO44772.1 DUF2752 domain-containing protein [Leeuwenhoekiella sp.]MBQ53151.1 DUF2752 domain-containing protein [Leeuwenhoekiella sp.]HBT11159.1 DUF2752 domain-containing protein [Leeuwenhoekiella sp.]|tara:strand:+ start:2117 stop:2392 length:276 start_codon:yes stop_codon:yes gene_type:complete